jgi:hypothetical protein
MMFFISMSQYVRLDILCESFLSGLQELQVILY